MSRSESQHDSDRNTYLDGSIKVWTVTLEKVIPDNPITSTLGSYRERTTIAVDYYRTEASAQMRETELRNAATTLGFTDIRNISIGWIVVKP